MNVTVNENISNQIVSVSNDTCFEKTEGRRFACAEETRAWPTEGPQSYKGQVVNNLLHGSGTYTWHIDDLKYVYEGKFYVNSLDGYGVFSYPDGKVFEGLFKENSRFGPGVQIYPDGTQDVGLWRGLRLVRLTRCAAHKIPALAETVHGQSYLLQYRTLIPVNATSPTLLEKELQKLDVYEKIKPHIHALYSPNVNNPNSLFFNRKLFDETYFATQSEYMLEVLENMDGVPVKRKIPVSDLLAWNNESTFIDIMKHTFLNRSFENTISFSVQEILNGRSKMFRGVGGHEQCCSDFLDACTRDADLSWYLDQYGLHPDVADGLGNSGVMYAAAFDKVAAIRVLARLGANLDQYNDECVTPLLVCLLRYIALKYDVNSWERAFLPAASSKARNEGVQEWKGKALQYPGYQTASLEVYVFDLSCAHPPKLAKGKPKKEKKKTGKDKKHAKDAPVIEKPVVEIDPKEPALKAIINTIVTLLCYGADSNLGLVPFPPLVLALFTRNVTILGQMIKFGADLNRRLDNEDALSPLHVICSLKPTKELLKLVEVLLRNGADPNQRAGPSHWLEEKINLVANCDVEDLGKTPMHLLAMRWDYDSDDDDVFGSIFSMFARYGADLMMQYLGHTPLSLAIMRGNLKLLAKMLNSCKVSADQELGNDMGVPLTVLLLKRYANTLPLSVSKSVLDHLISYHANPFNTIPGLGLTAFEFVQEENQPEEGKKKKKEKRKGDHFKLLQYFHSSAAHVLLRHIQARIVKFLYFNKCRNRTKHDSYDTLVSFLHVNDAISILQALIMYRAIRPQRELCAELLEYVDEKTAPKKDKKKKKGATVDPVEKLDLEKRAKVCFGVSPPEVDAVDKYRVCFECLHKTGKELVPCPKCKLVYFCSETCNNANNKKKGKHPCRTLFYATELQRMSELRAKGEHIVEFDDIIPVKKPKRDPLDPIDIDFGLECALSETSEGESSSEESEGSSSAADARKTKKTGKHKHSSTHSELDTKEKRKGKKGKHHENSEDNLTDEGDKKRKKNKKHKHGSTSSVSADDEKHKEKKHDAKVKEKSKGKKHKDSSESSVSEDEKKHGKKKHDKKMDDKKKSKKHKDSSSGSSVSEDEKKHKKKKNDANVEEKKKSKKHKDTSVLSVSEDEDKNKKKKDKHAEKKKRKDSSESIGSDDKTKHKKAKEKREERKGKKEEERDSSLDETKTEKSKSKKVKDKVISETGKKKDRVKSPASSDEAVDTKKTKRDKKKVADEKPVKETKKQPDRLPVRESISVERKKSEQFEKRARYSKSDSHLYKKQVTLKDKIAGNDLDLIAQGLSPEDITKFKEKFLPYCVLIDGELYYKFESQDVFYKLTYSSL